MNEAAAIAIIIVAVASCTVATNYLAIEKNKNDDPQAECVRRAWSQADRIECLKAVPPKESKP